MKHALLVSLSIVAACGGGQAASTPSSLGGTVPRPQPAPAPTVAPPAAATGTPKADLIPRDVLFGNPERAAVRISPDGKHLAWLAPKDGVLNVWVAPVGKLDQARPVTAETTRPIQRYVWAYTSKHLLYMQDRAGDENFHVFRADLDGKTQDLTPFPGARASIAEVHHAHPTTLIVRANNRDKQVFDLHRIDLLTGKTTLVLENTERLIDFTFDDAMNLRLGARKGADGSTEILIVDKRGKDGKVTWKPWDTIAFEDADTTAIVGFAPDGKSLYMIETRGRNTGALVQVNLATKRAKLLAEDPRADVGGALVHPTKHHVQAVAFDYDRERWKVLDKAVAKDLANLAKLDGGDANVTSRTLDDKTWLVATSSAQNPARYYVWNRAQQRGTFLFAAQPALEQQPLVAMHPVEIQARDGLTLVSYLSLPAEADANKDGKADKPMPMVLLVHGGPWARDSWGFNPYHQLLANRGYAVLSVNFRGSTGFGKQFMNAANLQWGKAMHDDLLDAVSWAVGHGVAPKDQVCIMGGSYGGYATLAGLAMTPDVFACGVDIVGPSNLLTLLETIPPYWAPMVAMFHTRMGNPQTAEGKQLLMAASPVNHAAKIKKPLLIAQGKNDPRVKEAESEQIVAAMKKHGLPVTYVLFPDEGHGFARPENNIAFTAVAEAFLSAHLGGFYLPITAAELEASSMQIKEGREGIPGLPRRAN